MTAIDAAHTYIYIHVMDFIPMLVYAQPKRYWPTIDNALRRAVVERGVHVLLLTAALHYAPIALRLQQSLASINDINGSMHVVSGGVAACTNAAENLQSARFGPGQCTGARTSYTQ